MVLSLTLFLLKLPQDLAFTLGKKIPKRRENEPKRN